MRAMIFAAGLGTRLKPLTDTMPKALVPVDGSPLLEHLILKMKAAGIDEIIVNVHHFADQIIEFLEEKQNFGIHIEISDEREMLLETGGGLKKARRFFLEQTSSEPFLVHNVDILSNMDFEALSQSFKPGMLASLAVSQRETSRYLLFDGNCRLCGWQNLKTGETKPADLNPEGLRALAFSGVQMVSPSIFSLMDGFPEKFSIIDLYLKAMSEGVINAYIQPGFRMMDVGKIDSLHEAAEFIKGI